MSPEFIILLIVVLLGFAGIFWVLRRRAEKPKQGEMLMLQNQLNELSRTMDTKLSESTKAMRDQFTESSKIVRDVTERLTKLDETNKQVINFTDQLRDLQDILKNPKQ